MRLQHSVPVPADYEAEVGRLLAARVPSRLAAKDASLFTDDEQPAPRMGWVDLPQRSAQLVDEIESLHSRLEAQGLRSISLTGMGGSSLAPEVMAEGAGVSLEVVDSTDPNQVAEAIGTDLSHTVLIVASKSGTTIETDAIRRAFSAAFESVGIDPASRLIAITDPGTELDALATEQGFLATFHTDETVGGRYSALSAFGLVPAGLAGVDVRAIAASAADTVGGLGTDAPDNPALKFGTWLGIGHARATEKLVLAETTPGLSGLSKWVEQLVAESLGKDGQGILPVVVNGPTDVGFCDARADAMLCTLGPVTDVEAPSGFDSALDGDLGELFVFWEFATAIAAYSIGVDPFDQPDVESAKDQARQALSHGSSAAPAQPAFREEQVEVFGEFEEATDLIGAIGELFAQVDEYGFVGVQAFLDRIADAEAQDLRALVSQHSGVQTTFGFGPRYLHSTGQYHKGGHPNGVFLQITAEPRTDLLVPGRGYGFTELQRAQALGDAAALREKGRPVLRVHLLDRAQGLDQLRRAIADVEPRHHYGVD
ncbi:MULTISPECIES: glucose-6-phosphate isomerase [Brevibacterium]|uniref:Glucose-6-phosphate isomerase n=2 Tax=Brevibacterium antiquum TaxID=234835 RepID=A0A2H1HP61_9MICO|nr:MULTISPECIES: glucose-6-phosphate isomerase [Brevibacterium]SMX64671.1 glucose-6-phosphate isomerase [Brevibacterium antiquum CNRZ 918]SMX65390.1 glucose-6-phosphate isomerase [Brevibacterium antiquum]HCG57294.1 glucose-6-phosphate isomerase [Brevibacterium sp.]